MIRRRLLFASRLAAGFLLGLGLGAGTVHAREFTTRTLSEPGVDARNPSIGETGLVAWQGHRPHLSDTPASTRSDVLKAPPGSRITDIYIWKNGEIRNITGNNPYTPRRNERPRVFGDSVLFTAWFRDDAGGGFPMDMATPPKTDTMLQMQTDYPTLFDPPQAAPASALAAELAEDQPDGEPPPSSEPPPEGHRIKESSMQFQQWRSSGPSGDIAIYGTDDTIQRITPGARHISNPVMSEAGVAFQVARGWPYGYEIFVWKPGDTLLSQLTTNYFYALNPDIHGQELVFQGWDGTDFEIFRYRFDAGSLEQITDNQFDDTHPVVWNAEIVWIAYPTINAEIFHYREGEIRKISEDSQDNSHPSIWEGQAVWQGYDEADLEIYYFNGRRTIKLTSNTWDDMTPLIRDGVITWMSYIDNSDAEVMALDLSDNIAVRLTDNDWEDSFPNTAGERVVWQILSPEGSSVMIAEPTAPRASNVN